MRVNSGTNSTLYTQQAVFGRQGPSTFLLFSNVWWGTTIQKQSGWDVVVTTSSLPCALNIYRCYTCKKKKKKKNRLFEKLKGKILNRRIEKQSCNQAGRESNKITVQNNYVYFDFSKGFCNKTDDDILGDTDIPKCLSLEILLCNNVSTVIRENGSLCICA